MIELVLFVLGILLLIKGAGILIDGSSSLAKRFGIPSIIIGLTVVAFGTSMPELTVNILAAITGNSNIAFGNVVGSNIANILLILGVSAFVGVITVRKQTLFREIPFSFIAAALLILFFLIAMVFGIKTSILRVEGIILLVIFVLFIIYILREVKKNKAIAKELKVTVKHRILFMSIILILGGLVALYFGGRWTVEGAVFVAKALGVSDYVIALTIISVGTSLPELMTSIIATKRDEDDIAIGNIVGSNIFNIVWILGLSSVISPIEFPGFAIVDLLVLLFATTVLFLFIFYDKEKSLRKWHGIVFLILFVGYVIFLTIR